MIAPSDKNYIETKQIMLGKIMMKQEFRKLADWIDQTYSVKTINIVYDTIENGRPRLEICFEFENEVVKFRDERNMNYDNVKQKLIAKFKQILTEQAIIEKSIFDILKKTKEPKYLTEDILVIYSAFAPVARIEANWNIPKDKIIELKNALNDKDLWEIYPEWSEVTFFLFTDEKVKEYENSDKRKEWTNQYFNLLKTYDQFGYFNRENFSIFLDSKEKFDSIYQGNWFYYSRR